VLRRWLIGALCLTVLFPSTSTAQTEARQVLLLNSFERGSAVENLFAGSFRTELGKQSSEPLNVFEVSLQATLTGDPAREAPVADYLRATFGGQRLDLVVSLGGPAAAFARKHRDRLFPSTPLLVAALERRSVPTAPFSASEMALPVTIDPPRVVEDILRLLPQTTTVLIVIGASGIEDFWRDELKRSLKRFESRLNFVYTNDLSFEDVLKRAGSLPPRSAIFYTLLTVDGHGVIQEEERTLAALSAAANAPMFGLYDIQLGRGIVGGSLIPVEATVRDTTGVAVRLLRGESPASIKAPDHTHDQPAFDWRELRRWGIREARLPAGSIVQFRQPTIWDQYKGYIVGVAVLFGLQSALLAGLVLQRARRRRTELALRRSEQQYRAAAKQNHDLAGRLITAQEAERTRIARDLHDDVSQQLAGVSIAFSGLKQRLGEHQISGAVQQELADLQHQTLALARNVRNLSHDLHPTVLQHLGLVRGLRSYCSQLERAHGVTMSCSADGDFASVSPEVALCVYRIAQEALRNVIAHAGASRVDVQLRAGDHVEITIADDGRGFDHARTGEGLGLVSIAERAKIAGGSVSIDTGATQGTRVHARIPAGGPVGSEASESQGQVA
jgi:signal transduction histidine kinase